MDGAIENWPCATFICALLPFAILSYFLANIDRINVSFAGLTMVTKGNACRGIVNLSRGGILLPRVARRSGAEKSLARL
jgi:hypothetical protein